MAVVLLLGGRLQCDNNAKMLGLLPQELQDLLADMVHTGLLRVRGIKVEQPRTFIFQDAAAKQDIVRCYWTTPQALLRSSLLEVPTRS